MSSKETALLFGGCFWGMQELVRKIPGVASTRVGYNGGDVANATYRNHGTHAEGIEIVFDPTVTSYRHILEFFFQIHDPTTSNRQGHDIGRRYRSAIFTHTPEQHQSALKAKAALEKSGKKIATQILPAGPFYRAEEYHQRYHEKHGGSCNL